MSEQEAPRNGPDEVIYELGGCGRFQIRFAVLIHLLNVVIVWSMHIMVFAGTVPKWSCIDDVNFTESINKSLEESCKTRNGTECSSFEFEEDMHTMVDEWDLVCDRAWIPPATASIQIGGLLLGNFFSGHIADALGRKRPIFFSLVLLIAFNVLAFFSVSWVMYTITRALIGAALGLFLTIRYNYMSEFCLSRWRPWVVGVPSWSIEACLFALVLWLLKDWRKAHLVTALIGVPFIATWWFIPESFRWYYAHDRIEDAERVITTISTVNRRPVPDMTCMKQLVLASLREENNTGKKYTALDLFKSRSLTKCTIILSLNWFALGLISYGIFFGIQNLSGSIYLNLFLFPLVEIPQRIFEPMLLNRFGRRLTTMFLFTFTGIMVFVVAIVQYIDTEHKDNLTKYFALASNFGIATTWPAVQTMTVEIYPTLVRNIGFGFCSVFGRVAAMLGPQLAFLEASIPGVLYFSCGGVAALCVCGLFFLPETKDSNLSDKLHETISPERGHEQTNGIGMTRLD